MIATVPTQPDDDEAKADAVDAVEVMGEPERVARANLAVFAAAVTSARRRPKA
jgi:hypothetical protein